MKVTLYTSVGLCLVLSSACLSFSPSPLSPPEKRSFNQQTKLSPSCHRRIMALGDSITQADWNYNSYRRALWFKLQQAGYSVDFVGSTRSHRMGQAPDPDFDQEHEGHWGWRVDEILPRVRQWAEAAQPDVVLIHLGTNDIGQSQSIESTIAELAQLIRSLRQVNPKIQVLLAEIIPMQGAEAEVQQFNRQIVRLAQRLTTRQSLVLPVDQFTGFNIAVGQDSYDGLHPNAAGEEKMATRWFASLQKVLPRCQTHL